MTLTAAYIGMRAAPHSSLVLSWNTEVPTYPVTHLPTCTSDYYYSTLYIVVHSTVVVELSYTWSRKKLTYLLHTMYYIEVLLIKSTSCSGCLLLRRYLHCKYVISLWYSWYGKWTERRDLLKVSRST